MGGGGDNWRHWELSWVRRKGQVRMYFFLSSWFLRAYGLNWMAAVLGASSSMLNSGQIFLFYLWRRWFSRAGSGISYSFLVSLTATRNQGSWLRRKPSGVSWWLLLVVKLRTILLRDAPKAKDGWGCSWLSWKPGVSGANTAREETCQTLPSLCGCVAVSWSVLSSNSVTICK